MGEVKIEICNNIESTQTLTPTKDTDEVETEQNNPIERWLPITESRDGNATTATLHLLCSGIGLQGLALPVAIAYLGWFWGVSCLGVAFVWQLYTKWLLVHLHQHHVSGTRHSRYLHLAMAAFGKKLGKILALFPVMYLSGGTCTMTIIIGGNTMKLFYQTLCEDGLICNPNALTLAEWFLIFACLASIISLFFHNLNSLAKISLIGAVTAIGYCTLLWVLSVRLKNQDNSSFHEPSKIPSSVAARLQDIVTALGIIALSFRGHNLVLEIQGTMPSSSKCPSHEPMWIGVKISSMLTFLCLLPLAIGGYWAYGNTVVANGSIMISFAKFHIHDTPKLVMGLIYLLILMDCLCSFQIYAMLVLDNFEFRYAINKRKKCSRWIQMGFRVFFGGLTFFIAIAIPFLPSLAALFGGIALPITYSYPCFMWIVIKKPTPNSGMWWFNLSLGCLGIVLSVVLVTSAAWKIGDTGMDTPFFHPQ